MRHHPRSDRCRTHNPDPPDMTRLVSRRGFLRAGLGAGAVLAGQSLVAPAAWAESCADGMGTVPPEQRSIQLYTMIPYMQASPELTLQQLYEIGYRKVEHAVVEDADRLRAACDDAGPEGIACTSGHNDIPHPYDEETFQATLEYASTAGQRFIVRASYNADDEAGWAAYGESLNRAGRVATDAGFEGVGHHNHTQEYTPFEQGSERRPIDVLMEVCDPRVVHMEMDICWVWSAETDPVPYLERYPGRYRQFHVKDMTPTGQPTFPGQGVIDFDRVFEAAARTQVIEEYIIEQDAAGAAAFETARMGWELLENAAFACPAPSSGPDTGTDGATSGSTDPSPADEAARGTPGSDDSSAAADATLPSTGGGAVSIGAALLGAAIALRRRDTSP